MILNYDVNSEHISCELRVYIDECRKNKVRQCAIFVLIDRTHSLAKHYLWWENGIELFTTG